ncbi:hypothetical protein [Desulfurivibrio sp. C05AmB]|uniref:hypothetical protein n=1 Tax=Desulfurivibrio sp. C05AmB TaxID=3374371 RepID=UPI00376EAF03
MTSGIHHCLNDSSHCILGEIAELSYFAQGQGHGALTAPIGNFEQLLGQLPVGPGHQQDHPDLP